MKVCGGLWGLVIVELGRAGPEQEWHQVVSNPRNFISRAVGVRITPSLAVGSAHPGVCKPVPKAFVTTREGCLVAARLKFLFPNKVISSKVLEFLFM